MLSLILKGSQRPEETPRTQGALEAPPARGLHDGGRMCYFLHTQIDEGPETP